MFVSCYWWSDKSREVSEEMIGWDKAFLNLNQLTEVGIVTIVKSQRVLRFIEFLWSKVYFQARQLARLGPHHFFAPSFEFVDWHVLVNKRLNWALHSILPPVLNWSDPAFPIPLIGWLAFHNFNWKIILCENWGKWNWYACSILHPVISFSLTKSHADWNVSVVIEIVSISLGVNVTLMEPYLHQ